MADYRPDWDIETVQLAEEIFDKHPRECSEGEWKALHMISEMRKRLKRVDQFIRGLM